jgi:hypothetical protein
VVSIIYLYHAYGVAEAEVPQAIRTPFTTNAQREGATANAAILAALPHPNRERWTPPPLTPERFLIVC